MATKKPDDKNAKADKAKDGKNDKGKDGKEAAAAPGEASIVMTEELAKELAELTNTQRAAVLMLLLGEQQASEIIRFMNPKEVQSLGAAMVSVADLSQEAVKVTFWVPAFSPAANVAFAPPGSLAIAALTWALQAEQVTPVKVAT